MLKHLLIFALAALPAAAIAQSTADTTVVLPPAVVEATRAAQSDAAPVRVTTIDLAGLETTPVRSVADALDRLSGANIVRYGATGYSTASLRGLGGKHTEIFLDGLLLSDPQSNQVDLSIIPLVMLESIEITHGPGSAARGPGSLGGAVALTTLQAAEQPRLKVGLDGGSYGLRSLGGAAAGKAGPVAITLAGEISQYDGDFPYSNPTLIDQTEQIRTGADKSSATGYANAIYVKGSNRTSGSVWVNSVDRGLPGPANAPPSDARQWDDHLRIWVTSDQRLGLWNAGVRVLEDRADLRYVDPAGGTDETTSTTTTEAQGTVGRTFGNAIFLSGGASAGFDRSSEISETRLAAFSDATIQMGRLILSPSARVEDWVTAERANVFFIPRAGVNLRLNETGSLRLKANVGRSYRPPSFLERFWRPGGNPSLVPETGWSFDVGAMGRAGDDNPVHAEVSVFRTDLTNQIAWFPSLVGSGVQVWRPFNVGRVVTYGTELSAEATRRVGSAVTRVGISSTLSRALDRSDSSTRSYDKQLRYTPEFTGMAYLDVDLGPASGSLTVRHVGQRFITSDESMSLAGYTVFDAVIAYEPAIGASKGSVAIQIENVFNVRYSVIRFYPMPPRSVTLRFGVDLSSK